MKLIRRKKRALILAMAIFLLVLIPLYIGLGSYSKMSPRPALYWPMFRHDPRHTSLSPGKSDITRLKTKWSLPAGNLVESSPAIGDIDGDGKAEVIALSYSGKMYVLDGLNGKIIKPWPTTIVDGKRELSSPALGDVDRDGRIEIIIGTRKDKRVYCLDAKTGDVEWFIQAREEIWSSPTLIDINGDKRMEIVIGSDRLYVLDGKGSHIWSHLPELGIRSTPTVGDIDGDGDLEIVFMDMGSTVYALSASLRRVEWKQNLGYGEGLPFSSPALGDINGDGKPEIAVAISKKGIYVLSGRTGEPIRDYPIEARVKSSPAIGDIDNDGQLEIVIGANDRFIYAFKYGLKKPFWKYRVGDIVESSPALGDIDGDGELEVIVGSHDGKLYVLNGANGHLKTKFRSGGQIFSSPALGDIDGDGKLEIVFGNNAGIIYALE